MRKKINFFTIILSLFCLFHTPLSVAKNSKTTNKKSSGWFASFSKNKKKSSTKKRSVAPHSNVHLDKMTEPQLKEVLDYINDQKNPDIHFKIKVLSQLIRISTDHAQTKIYKLNLADLHYELHHIEIAALQYESYAQYYPGSAEAEYCMYKAVLCMFNISLDPDRSQENTKKTIELAKNFLAKASDPELKKEVQVIKYTCIEKLFDKEIYVLRFYLQKKKYGAVEIRLNYIEKHFKDQILNFESKFKALQDEINAVKNPTEKKQDPSKPVTRKRKLLG